VIAAQVIMVTVTVTDRYGGIAHAQAWDRLHPRLTRRAGWLGFPDELSYAFREDQG
jgi:hypothetical protein